MCPAIPISNIYGINPDTWNASAYEALSVAWRTSATVKTFKAQAVMLGLARDVWALDRILRDLLEGIYKAVEHPDSAPVEPVTNEQLLEAAELLRNIHATVDRVYTRAKSKGLTNRRLVGPVFNSVKTRAEEILEISEAIALSVDPNVDALLTQALDDLHSGKDLHDLPTFK